MKTKIPGIIAVVAAMFVLHGGTICAPAQSVQQIYEDAKAAYHRGDLISAKAGLERVVRADPRHSTARAYLARVSFEMKQKEGAGSTTMMRNLEGVIVPTVDFNDATLGSVIEFIPKKTAELTENKLQPSIIFKGDPALLQQKKVTLKLSNVPMSEVLRYVGEMTQVQFKYEKYAIVATPLGATTVEVAAPETPKKPADSDPFGVKPVADPFE